MPSEIMFLSSTDGENSPAFGVLILRRPAAVRWLAEMDRLEADPEVIFSTLHNMSSLYDTVDTEALADLVGRRLSLDMEDGEMARVPDEHTETVRDMFKMPDVLEYSQVRIYASQLELRAKEESGVEFGARFLSRNELQAVVAELG